MTLCCSGTAFAEPSHHAAVGSAPAPPERAATGDSTAPYEATIRRTTFGVAHIEAANLPSLGFGEGYAQAEDHACTIADQVIRVRGERAKWFGRGTGDRHLRSDIVMRGLRVRERAGALLEREPQEIRDWVHGFAAGFNRYLQTAGRAGLPGWCRGAEWVQPIEADDIAALHRVNLLAVVNMLDPITAATPPASSGSSDDASRGERPSWAALDDEEVLRALQPPATTASNGWAIGRDRTVSGRGMLLANPHYPWSGSNRFWEKHLRIPGRLDVYGVNLIGGLGVLIGFNEAVAWTHTTSAARRFTLYSVDLVPGSPTRYRVGDEERDMSRVDVTVEVHGEAAAQHSVWFTHHGPVIAPSTLPWTDRRAYTVRDASDENGAIFAHLLATNHARSLDEMKRIHGELQALTGLATMAVSAEGVAWYLDGPGTPNLGAPALAALLQRRQNDPMTRQLWQNGIVLLDGSDQASAWIDAPDAGRGGIVPYSRLPQLERTDYVFNANGSYGFAHHEARVGGEYTALLGDPHAPLSARTRMNALVLSNRRAAAAAGADGRFSLDELQRVVLGNHSVSAELLVPQLVDRCRATPSLTLDSSATDLGGACEVLAAWDRRFDLESRGAVLFREWLGRYPVSALERRGPLFADDFDPADPLAGPQELAPGGLALENLARAARLLTERGIALDISLGELQHAPTKLPRRIAVHGGGHREGVLNLMLASFSPSTTEPITLPTPVRESGLLTDAGYPVLHGTSFLMAVEFTASGPRGQAILTYGQSGDPTSVHFIDQTELFARKEWRPTLFRTEEIVTNTQREYRVSNADN